MVYIKKVSTNDKRFSGREMEIRTWGTKEEPADGDYPHTQHIPVPNNVVLCNGCNKNIVETEEKEGYLVYLDKLSLEKDHPYDFYCRDCTRKYFPKAVEV